MDFCNLRACELATDYVPKLVQAREEIEKKQSACKQTRQAVRAAYARDKTTYPQEKQYSAN